MISIKKLVVKNNIKIIEDCSQAHGAEINGQKVGTFGSLAAFSCYPTKNLGGTGDGAVILCPTPHLAEKLKTLRQYGWNDNRESMFAGFNSRLDEIQAAILQVKLKYLTISNQKRLSIANKYNDAFFSLPIKLPSLHENQLHGMHLYVIEFERRDELLCYLRENGVGASLHYPLAVHQHAAYQGRIHGHEDLPVTEQFYKRHLTLPLYPELPDHLIEMIISEVLNFFKDY